MRYAAVHKTLNNRRMDGWTMALHGLNKGKEGEREVARVLNGIVRDCLLACGMQVPERDVVQRNQNQSAVGGSDLTGCFGLSIEVKRQEQLSVNTWWKQCVAAAGVNGEVPVLVYRQNRRPWRVVTMGWLVLPEAGGSWAGMGARVEMDWDTFQQWFKQWVQRKLENGEVVRV